MPALVVFESMFGNTREIARAIGEGLSASTRVDVVEVGDAPPMINDDVALLVVGGPTHAFGMTRPSTRRDAAKQACDVVTTGVAVGMREWIAGVRGGSPGRAVAAFDTRIDKPRVPGSAARGAEKRLRRLGFRVVAPAETFFVDGTSGPLSEGERERAHRWGEQLGAQLAVSGQGRPAV